MSTDVPIDVIIEAPDDASDDETRRKYDATGRQRDAAQRRARIIEAARELFLEQGYGTTSIEQIAQRATTSAQTVYAAFGNKAGVLRRVIDVSIAGDDANLKVLDRPATAAMFATPDPRERIRLIAQLAADTHRRSGELVCLVERVSAADPAAEALFADLRAQLRDDAERVVDTIPAEWLRTDLDRDRLVDISILLGEARTWCSLVVERGWSDEEYAEWFADALLRNLVAEP